MGEVLKPEDQIGKVKHKDVLRHFAGRWGRRFALLATLIPTSVLTDAHEVKATPGVAPPASQNKVESHKLDMPPYLIMAIRTMRNKDLLDIQTGILRNNTESINFILSHLDNVKITQLLDNIFAIESGYHFHELLLRRLRFNSLPKEERAKLWHKMPTSLKYVAIITNKKIVNDTDALKTHLKDTLDSDKNALVFNALHFYAWTATHDMPTIVSALSQLWSVDRKLLRASLKNAVHNKYFWMFAYNLSVQADTAEQRSADSAEKKLYDIFVKSADALAAGIVKSGQIPEDLSLYDYKPADLINAVFVNIDKKDIAKLLGISATFAAQLNLAGEYLRELIWSKIDVDLLKHTSNEYNNITTAFIRELGEDEPVSSAKKLYLELRDRDLYTILRNALPGDVQILLFNSFTKYKAWQAMQHFTDDDILRMAEMSPTALVFATQHFIESKIDKNSVDEKIKETLTGFIKQLALKNNPELFAAPQTLSKFLSSRKFWYHQFGENLYIKTVELAASHDPLLVTDILNSSYLRELKIGNINVERMTNVLLRGVLRYVESNFNTQDRVRYKTQYNVLMRVINNLHAAEYTKWRQVLLEKMTALHRYWLSVYGASEVFTSTSSYVNYILPTLFQDISAHKEGLTGYLNKVDPNRKGLGTLVLIVTRYDKLQEFLKYAKIDNPSELLLQLLGSLQLTVDHAQAVIKILLANFDARQQANLEQALFNTFKKASSGSDELLKRKIRTLASLYAGRQQAIVSSDPQVQAWFKESLQKEQVYIPAQLDFDALYSKEEDGFVHRQIWFFMEGGDKDGIKSRWSAAAHLKKAGFKQREVIQVGKGADKQVFVFEKKSGGKRAVVFLSPVLSSNIKAVSQEERSFLQDILLNQDVHAIAYRGHSTYVPEFASLLKSFDLKKSKRLNLSLVNLGSCGGALSIETVQDALPKAVSAWIATEGTGSTSINDPLYVALLDEILKIRNEQALNFVDFENKMLKQFGSNRLFKSYKLPHKNFPAVLKYHFSRIESDGKLDKAN